MASSIATMQRKDHTKAEWYVHPTCGVEVNNLTLANLSQENVNIVKQQFAKHGVVYFRGIDKDAAFNEKEHIQFARQIGTINVNRFFQYVENFPEISLVSKSPEDKQAIGQNFHADHTYDTAPATGSILVARQLPKSGGETIFVDMRKAYDNLSNELKEKISNLRAVHSSRHVFGRTNADRKMYENPDIAVQDNVHPVVIKHPVSGRNVLFVNPGFTICFEGQTPEESAELLQTLYHHAVQKENMFVFKWTPGSAVMWDNRAVWHCACNNYPGMHRVMHRVTLDGVELESADSTQLGSKKYDQVCPDVSKPTHYGQTILELPVINNLITTLDVGTKQLGMENWSGSPPLYQRVALKAMALLKIPLFSKL